jgi:hypothetical protein
LCRLDNATGVARVIVARRATVTVAALSVERSSALLLVDDAARRSVAMREGGIMWSTV